HSNGDRRDASSTSLAVCGWLEGRFIGVGFARGRATDRYVEVKGVAERDVTADLALWPLRVVTAGNDLVVAQARIGQNISQVYAFLKRHGIDTSQVEVQGVDVTDAFANAYGGERQAQV